MKHADHIGYFVIREEEGSAEIEVQDAEPMETREQAEAWIQANGAPGVDYWVCAPVGHSIRKRG